jgi:dipeptidyl aminopeptidase/acylaminoacyl peptidase
MFTTLEASSASAQKEPVNPALLKALVRGRQALSSGQPHSFQFADLNTVVFLGADPATPSFPPATSLHAARISPSYKLIFRNEDDSACQAVKWTPMLPAPAVNPNAHISREEELRRERSRTTTLGIQSFNAQAKKLLLPLNGGISLSSFPSPAKPEDSSIVLPPMPRMVTGSLDVAKTYIDATLSPDGALIAFSRFDDLWVLDVASGSERRLTYSENANSSDWRPGQAEASQVQQRYPLTARQPTRADYSHFARVAAEEQDIVASSVRQRTRGVPDYIALEEFDRANGFWWRPRTGRNPVSGNYEILYLAVEHDPSTVVQISKFQTSFSTGSETERFHYPCPGQTNCVSEPAIVMCPPPPLTAALLREWSAEDPRDVSHEYSWAPARTARSQFPWSEYVVRAGWLDRDEYLSDSDRNETGTGAFWLQLLDRRQKRLEYVVFPAGGVLEASGIRILCDSNRDGCHVKVNDAFHFLRSGSGLLYCSEATGFASLWHKDLSCLRISSTARESVDETALLPGNTRLITDTATAQKGMPWRVENVEHVDEKRQLVYFTCTSYGQARCRCMRSASYDANSKANDCSQLFLDTSYVTNIAFHESGDRFVATVSQLDSPPCSAIYDVVHHPFGYNFIQQAHKVAIITNPTPHPATRVPWPTDKPPQFFDFRAANKSVIHGAFYWPGPELRANSNGPAPTVLQLVSIYLPSVAGSLVSCVASQVSNLFVSFFRKHCAGFTRAPGFKLCAKTGHRR